MRLLIVTLGVALIGWHGALAQRFLDRISLEEGLSQSQAHCMLQDSHGYMWIGTQHGLNRYDGFDMQHFYHNPFDSTTISHDDIWALFEDSHQQLWVGVENGLNRYDPLHNAFVRYDNVFITEQSPSGQTITGIAEDLWQTIWVSTQRGLWRFIPKGDTYQIIPFAIDSMRSNNLSSVRVWRLAADEHGEIWVGTANGLNKIVIENPNESPANQKIRFLNAGNSNAEVFRQMSIPIHRMFCGSDGVLWAASQNRLFRVDVQHQKLVEVTNQLIDSTFFIAALLVDRLGDIWVGTFGGGIYRYRMQDDRLQFIEHIEENQSARKGLRSNFIFSLYESKEANEDVVWIGTREAGVQLYSRSKNSFRQWDQILAKDSRMTASSVFSICTDSYGYLWAGTYDGIFRVNRTTNESKQYRLYPKHRPMNEFQAMLEDRNKNLWIGSNEGLFRYDRKRDTFRRKTLPDIKGVQPMVSKLYEDRAGHIWVGTSAYLFQFDPKSGEEKVFRKISDAEDAEYMPVTTALCEDTQGNLWIGTMKGLILYQPKSEERTWFCNDPKDPKSLIDNYILDIYCTPDGQLWLCSPRGLSKLVWENGKITFKHYTEREGLPNNFVYGILPDNKNRLWLSTNAGLSCFDPATETFRNFDSNDGLASREFNSGAFHRSNDGELFFGGLGVFVSFRPDHMVENQHLPKVTVTSFQRMEEELPFHQLLATDGKIRLKYNDDLLSLHLAAFDYTNPTKNEFAYRLKGLKDDWIYLGNRRYLSFTHLNPGDYTLEIKGSNNQERWNEHDILSIPISITPPFWQTWWFYSLVALFTGLTVVSVNRYRLQMKVQRAVELERVKLEENERVRKLAAQDLHDEFGNTLTRISLLTELIKAKSNGSANGEIGNLLTKISDNASRMYQGTKDFIWAINPEHDNFHEVAIRLKDFGDDTFDKTGINFRVSGIDESLKTITLPMGASRHLVMLFKEAMTNTLKHAQATEVCLQFLLKNDLATIVWRDNGLGFESSKANGGNGLQNMRNRAKRIGAGIKIDSSPEKGVKVTVTLQANSIVLHTS